MIFDRLESIHPWLPLAAAASALVLVALVADLVVKRVLLRLVRHIATRTMPIWAETLQAHNVFNRFARVLPALVIYSGVELLPGIAPTVASLVRNVAMGYVVLMVTMSVTSGLSAAGRVYERRSVSRTRPLKGVIQVVQITAWVLGGILIIAAILDRDPALLLSGIGAMTAVLLLVFRDTLLGFVASVQLSAHDMVRVGDWIQMDRYGADGDVIDVALHTVKVQNFDKTITTIPTQALIADAFRNWRGMIESGGRRIKRTISIDQSSIRFLDDDEVAKFKQFALLTEHIETKERELDEYHASLGDEGRTRVNRRRLTNVGMFRAYVRSYLYSHPKLRSDMTLLVRQLAPGPTGLPIEIYCFTNTTEWREYEDIQSDIFDHVIAIVSEFALEIFQNPAGTDLLRLRAAAPAAAGGEDETRERDDDGEGEAEGEAEGDGDGNDEEDAR